MKQLSQSRPQQSVWDFMSEVERIFDDAWAPSRAIAPETAVFQPRIDVKETKDHYLVAADLPGINKDQVRIDFHQGRLTITGERAEEKVVNEPQVHRRERVFGRFERSFQLPQGINEETIQARMEDGVLEILIPKPHQAKAKSINIEGERKGLFSKLINAVSEKKAEAPEKDDQH
ncbi:MAG: Hsp20/alpha crystallin family protein [Bdellovibrionales bacterium]